MIMYVVTMGNDEFDPWCGIPTAYIHKTMEGAWEDLERQLDELIFKQYGRGIRKIYDIDFDVNNNRLVVTYGLDGFPTIVNVLTLQIQVLSVVD